MCRSSVCTPSSWPNGCAGTTGDATSRLCSHRQRHQSAVLRLPSRRCRFYLSISSPTFRAARHRTSSHSIDSVGRLRHSGMNSKLRRMRSKRLVVARKVASFHEGDEHHGFGSIADDVCSSTKLLRRVRLTATATEQNDARSPLRPGRASSEIRPGRASPRQALRPWSWVRRRRHPRTSCRRSCGRSKHGGLPPSGFEARR